MYLNINVTGGGTKQELIDALHLLIEDIRYATPETMAEGVEWQDATLLTTIAEASEEEVAEWLHP